MLPIEFHPDIALEIKSSYQWYQNQVHGLGDDFLSELEKSYTTIQNLPDTWSLFFNHFRRFLLSRFPFSIIYRIDNNRIYVVAVMHNNRKPYYWIDRTKR
jgi:hypothetical protein